LRDQARQDFIKTHGWGSADVTALAPDASFRSYRRLADGDRRAMLMDAPPGQENLHAYLDLTAHLRGLGLRVPEIYAEDRGQGFALIEDFGDDTFTRLLSTGADERTLYLLATDTLLAQQAHGRATEIKAPAYDMATLLREAEVFVDWYVPAVRGAGVRADEKARYIQAFEAALAGVAIDRSALVLRDYHVDNLMIVGASGSIQDCGLLDYQDALVGSPAYDLVSLVEDARRDVTDATREAVLARYFEGRAAGDRAALERDMAILGAQRHAKVAGLFLRLSRRDNKHVYLKHIPRVVRLLERNLRVPELEGVRAAVLAMLPEFPNGTF
jgi:aminoglycoside/choline kinase family phosphotransferase